jgi:hypothetical protein
MNKKILLGSIISVVILILVSFTSVVGYNNIESDIQSSPLFNIRSSRAIDEENKDLSCEYVGKGIENNIFIPKRIDGISPFLKFIYSLIKINEKVHNPNINNLLQQYIHNDIIEIEQISEIEDKVNQLNEESDILNEFCNPLASTNPPTGTGCCMTAEPPIWCTLFLLIIAILAWFGII